MVHSVPGDPGGTTKWGFAQRYNPDIDVTTLTFAAAYLRFVSQYWTPLMCSSLPFPLALALCDQAFNMGADDAVPALQRAVRASVDGVMGERTLNAANTLYSHDPRRTLNDALSYRLMSYANNPRVADNRGWFVRVLALRAFVEKEIA